MKLDWQISREDVARIKAFVNQQTNNKLVQFRRANNLADIKPQVRRNDFWCQMVRMRLTSIQKSGPNSHVSNFNRTKPFPLSYKLLCSTKKPESFIAEALTNAGGIRFGKTMCCSNRHLPLVPSMS
jgi:predicted transport protein